LWCDNRLLGALLQKGQVQPINSLLADSSLHDASFVPRDQLFINWWQELSSTEAAYTGIPTPA